MSSKRFESINDFLRHGFNMGLECANGHCRHSGVVAPYEASRYFKLQRWPEVFEAGALRRFRCTRCGDRAGRARPTERPPTVIDFFPADEKGWQMLVRRVRG